MIRTRAVRAPHACCRPGPRKIAKKLGEEAVEVALECAAGNRDEVVRESADLLYHLVVLWYEAGVQPKEIWAEMDRREKLYGIAEKITKNRRGRTQASGGGPDRSCTAPTRPLNAGSFPILTH